MVGAEFGEAGMRFLQGNLQCNMKPRRLALQRAARNMLISLDLVLWPEAYTKQKFVPIKLSEIVTDKQMGE